MNYEEKWLALKADMEKAVNHGLQSIGQMDVKDQNRLAAYRYVLDYMNELDGNEKIKEKSEEEKVDAIVTAIVDHIFN